MHLGDTLYQDVLTQFKGASNHKISTEKHDYTHIAHHLVVEPSSQLAAITGANQLDANTHHHQGIKDLAPLLRASAYAEDGLIEAVEHTDKTFARRAALLIEGDGPSTLRHVRIHKRTVREIDDELAAVSSEI